MHGVIPGADLRASEVTGRLVSDSAITDHLVSDDESDWFSEICEQLVPNDPGPQLRHFTGFEERTCYRYAAGDRKPPGYFIRALLRSDGGWPWLCALMDGSDAPWWRELQRARRIAEAIAAVE